MDILGIGRESTYRRIRCNIPFTFEEIVKLSSSLDFSIDEVVERNLKGGIMLSDLPKKVQYSCEQYFYVIHTNYYKMLQQIINARKVEISISLNRLFSFFVVNFDVLFKFYYFAWIHRLSDNSFNSRFSDIQLPEQVVSIQQKTKEIVSSVKNITFIFDRYILQKLINDLQYYYIRKLISDEELQEIKDNIICFIDYIEDHIQAGEVNDETPTNHFYLSPLDIDMNSVYGTINGEIISQFWTYAETSQAIGKYNIIASHNNWIHSLKRSSILISQSNEIAQATFLNQQRKNIDMITNDLFLYYG